MKRLVCSYGYEMDEDAIRLQEERREEDYEPYFPYEDFDAWERHNERMMEDMW